jgi:phenylalanyl-tRNA synthetase beta chain
MEVDFSVLTDLCRLDRPYRPVAAYPATCPVLAVVVSDSVLWADIERCVRASAPDILESVDCLTVYRGTPVPTGRKSVAIGMVFRRTDRTIKAEEAEEARQSVLRALEQRLHAKLR